MRESGVSIADIISDEFELEGDWVIEFLVSLECILQVSHIIG